MQALANDARALDDWRRAARRAPDLGAFHLTLVPIRPRSRGERHSLRTLPGASLRPRLAFNPRPRRLSTPLLTPFNSTPTFVASYGPSTLIRGRRRTSRARGWGSRCSPRRRGCRCTGSQQPCLVTWTPSSLYSGGAARARRDSDGCRHDSFAWLSGSAFFTPAQVGSPAAANEVSTAQPHRNVAHNHVALSPVPRHPTAPTRLMCAPHRRLRKVLSHPPRWFPTSEERAVPCSRWTSRAAAPPADATR